MKGTKWLVREARRLMLDFDAPGNARGAALLARQALEDSVESYLEARYGALSPRPDFSSMLVVLDVQTDQKPILNELAKRISWTWSALSAACHVHAYPLDPTIDELERWLTTIDEFVSLTQA